MHPTSPAYSRRATVFCERDETLFDNVPDLAFSLLSFSSYHVAVLYEQCMQGRASTRS